jgi:hypothetical protein
MAASEARVLKRVTEMLNLVDAGTYSSTISSRNKTRNALAIADFVAEAGLMITKAIAERPNEFRRTFLSDTTVTTSGNQMPPHLGPPAKVAITPYAGGTPMEGRRTSFDKIESYRENPENVYDPIDHDQEGSTLAGLYDIWDDRFFFTGESAVLSLARPPVRADNATAIPEFMENTWIRLGIGESAKVGVSDYATRLITEYGARGKADLEEFKAGGRVFTEVDVPQQSPVDHNLVR